MNALELADAMEIRASIRRKATSRKSVTEGANDRLADQLEQASTMLRQQQAEIESMQERMIVAEKELNHMRSFFGCDPAYYGMTSAEPVAWMIQAQTWHEFTFIEPDMEEVEAEEWSVTPLYTHPAKTLTDEEILEVAKEKGWRGALGFLITFARAILRKAQEK